jgi:hypothetical protein
MYLLDQQQKSSSDNPVNDDNFLLDVTEIDPYSITEM